MDPKMNNSLMCIYCWIVINVLVYTSCAILQWVLFVNERFEKVACVQDVALAAAMLSSLATFVKYIAGSFGAYLHATKGRLKILIIMKNLLNYDAVPPIQRLHRVGVSQLNCYIFQNFS